MPLKFNRFVLFTKDLRAVMTCTTYLFDSEALYNKHLKNLILLSDDISGCKSIYPAFSSVPDINPNMVDDPVTGVY